MTFPSPINYLSQRKKFFAAFVCLICGVLLTDAQSIYKSDFEGSEGYTLNALDGQLAWAAGNLVTVDVVDPFSGMQLIWLPQDSSDTGSQVFQTFSSVLNNSTVYVDFYLSPNAATSFQDLPGIINPSIAALSGLVNKGNGLGEWAVAYGDGSGSGVWQSTSRFISLEGNAASEYLWYVYKLDYDYKVYDFFLNGANMSTGAGASSAKRFPCS